MLKQLLPALLSAGLVWSSSMPSVAALPDSTLANFQSKDGVKLGASVYSQAKAKGIVLLLPMLGRTQKDYDSLVKVLTGSGFSVIALDFRGHGASVYKTDGSSLDFRTFTDADWSKLPEDVDQVLKSLPGSLYAKGEPLFIVGASIGANVACYVAARHPCVKGIVLLSPGLNYKGLEPEKFLKKTQSSVLIMASSDDVYAFDSSKQMAQGNPGKIKMEFYANLGHGTQMLAKNPACADKIVQWLLAQVK